MLFYAHDWLNEADDVAFMIPINSQSLNLLHCLPALHEINLVDFLLLITYYLDQFYDSTDKCSTYPDGKRKNVSDIKNLILNCFYLFVCADISSVSRWK